MSLTPKQSAYVSYRLKGFQPTDAARLAGYADNGGSMIRVTAYRLEHNDTIQTLFQHATNRKNLKILRRIRQGYDVPNFDLSNLLSWGCLSLSGREMVERKLVHSAG